MDVATKGIFSSVREEVASLIQNMDGDEDTARRIAIIKKELAMCVAQHPQIIKDPDLKMIPDAIENTLDNLKRLEGVSKKKLALGRLLRITENR
jgi:hypothetical protein